MKILSMIIAVLLLVSCGKQEPPSQPKAVASPKPAVATSEQKTQPHVPQGKLPMMNPEKAQFIAVPSTPKDPEVKEAKTPAEEPKKADASDAEPRK